MQKSIDSQTLRMTENIAQPKFLPPWSADDEIVGVQAVQCHVLESYRVVMVERDHGVVADLVARGPYRIEIPEHAAVELDAIGVAEVGDGVVTESGPEHEGVVAVSAG